MSPYVVSVNDEFNTIFYKLLTELQSITGLPAGIKANQLDLEPPSMWFSPQGQSQAYNRDIAGNFWVDYPFMVYVRATNNDDFSVAECFKALDEVINKHFINSGTINLGAGRYAMKIEQTQGANIASATEDGVVDYVATYILTYLQTKEDEYDS